MSEHPAPTPAGSALLALYDRALPQVYGYLAARCDPPTLAEDLTAETFLAAVDTIRRTESEVTIPWLVGIARHKLADHYRRQAREHRNLHAAATDHPRHEDPWVTHLDVLHAHEVLRSLPPHHRAALTLRYLDDQPVPEVARLLDRTVHATEALLVRARNAFRRAYADPDDDGKEAGRD